MRVSSLELCAGAGGQALGLEMAGFEQAAAVEIDRDACKTLRVNRPNWNVIEADIRNFSAREFRGIDVLAAGLPCPPFSIAGKKLGEEDERNLFPDAFRIISECAPKAVIIENVKGFLDPKFAEFRASVRSNFEKLGYSVDWRLLQASDFGVSQLRPRVAIVGFKADGGRHFNWPLPLLVRPCTVGNLLYERMSERGWIGADAWRNAANGIAPTLVGGSKKHGGPDLGPTRARQAWALLGVDGTSIAAMAPERDFIGLPKLTVGMAAAVQGFPDNWVFEGKKTSAYRQVGNAFPPPVAKAVAERVMLALSLAQRHQAA